MELAKIYHLLAADDYPQLFATFEYARTVRQRFIDKFDNR